MKYAFIIGSNAFIVPRGVISYGEKDSEKEFLKINSIYHDTKDPVEGSFLDIDLNIKDTDGTPVVIIGNKPATGAPYNIKKERNSIQVLRSDGSMIIHVHQLDDEAAMDLEHNIVAELEVHAPIAVIRINGDFLVDSLSISAENEKLYINQNGYATSAMVGQSVLKFTSDGVIL
jgi:hypothetical protein